MAKILLVEDDKSLREIYSVRLMAEGYEIVSAGDGEEALAMAIKERPDLIVSDVMMPKISGFDMLDILRSTTETKDVKVIMMTALSSEDQRARGEALGADRYLVKSQVGIEDVVRTVHDVLGDAIAPVAAPVFPPAMAPVAAPQFMPAPLPVAPVVASAPFEAPVAPPVEQVAPVYVAPAPFAAPFPMPAPAAAPAFTPLPVAPVFTEAPVMPAQPFAPLPVVVNQPPVLPPVPAPYATPSAAPFAAPVQTPEATPTFMPQPTAPFSTAASLGERVISPLSDPTNPAANVLDLSSQMDQALNGIVSVPPTPPTV